LSNDDVTKYFEVRLFSLVLMAVSILIVCTFLFFLFISREQSAYAVVVSVLMVIILLAALELSSYAKSLKKARKEGSSENPNSANYIAT
jgi:FlaA1/EpsC-like NDP-sugar epimerase